MSPCPALTCPNYQPRAKFGVAHGTGIASNGPIIFRGLHYLGFASPKFGDILRSTRQMFVISEFELAREKYTAVVPCQPMNSGLSLRTNLSRSPKANRLGPGLGAVTVLWGKAHFSYL